MENLTIEYQSLEDKVLVNLCLTNHAAAWDEFVERYNRLIYNKIHRTLEVMNCYSFKERIDDIYQEVFVKILKSLESVSDFTFFRAWLVRVAFTVTVDFIRTEGKKGSKHVDQDISEMEFAIPENPDQEEVAIEKETKKKLDAAFDELDTNEVVVIKLLYLYQKKYKEIAKIFGITISMVSRIKERAENKLFAILKEDYQDDFT